MLILAVITAYYLAYIGFVFYWLPDYAPGVIIWAIGMIFLSYGLVRSVQDGCIRYFPGSGLQKKADPRRFRNITTLHGGLWGLSNLACFAVLIFALADRLKSVA